jgi:urea transport system permease protein
MGVRKSDGAFVLLTPTADGYALRDLSLTDIGTAEKSDITELRPNAGVRALIATALVQFTLSDPDPAKRADALACLD